jgi:hypothetical protein
MLVRIFRADPLLAALTTLLCFTVLLPLWVTPFIPLHDLPDHVGLASLMGDVLFGDGVAAHHFRVQALPVPYWGSYLIVALVGAVVGPLAAAKAVVATALLVLPLGTMRLLVAMKRSPRLGLFAFVLCWDQNLAWGFVAYVLALGLALFALAKLVEATSPRQALKNWPWVVAVALTHAHAFALLVVVATVYALAHPSWLHRLKSHALALAPGIGTLLPWAFWRAVFGEAHETKTPKPTEFHSLSVKLEKLFAYSLDVYAGKPASFFFALAFVGLAFGVVVLGFTRQEKWVAETRSALGVFVAALCLYLFLPMTIYWPVEQWYIYPRQATALLVFALFVPRPNLEGRRAFLLAPVVAMALAVHASVAMAHWDFAERARPFLDIIEALPKNQRLLTLTLDDGDPAIPLSPYNQFHAYAIAVKGGYDPHLFDNPSHPIVPRKDHALPHPKWNQMGTYSLQKHGRYYDHVLVQDLRRDPLARKTQGKVTTHLVKESGRWRLYAIENPSQDRPSPP